MLEVQTKVKRQIEILGLAIDNPQCLKDADFAVLFGRDIPTIKRDMQELRGLGIPIHSEKKRGICLDGKIDAAVLRELIQQYMGICNSTSGFDKATRLLVKKKRQEALSTVVTLQRCIDTRTVAVVDYMKDELETERGRELHPLIIFSSEGFWRVLAVNDGRIKQYLVDKILSVRATERHFTKVPQEQIDDLFRYSFRSWVGAERHHIRIHLSAVWAMRLKPRQMMETQVIKENDDGSVEFEAVVNSLQEIASWAVSRGSGVTVMEPAALREMVVQLARGALANYP
ncbi:MAG TPA: WYL domain-containing transcriptional regulator [Bacteroidota bacterium]|nr:WYL domain-containing transcriptional regulator [Bacteroidota bacterium]